MNMINYKKRYKIAVIAVCLFFGENNKGFVGNIVSGACAGSIGYALGGIIGDGIDARFKKLDATDKAKLLVEGGSFDTYRATIKELLKDPKKHPENLLKAFFYLREDAPELQHYAYSVSLLGAASCNVFGVIGWGALLVALNSTDIVDTKSYISYLNHFLQEQEKKQESSQEQEK